jgi:hypothetical protein
MIKHFSSLLIYIPIIFIYRAIYGLIIGSFDVYDELYFTLKWFGVLAVAVLSFEVIYSFIRAQWLKTKFKMKVSIYPGLISIVILLGLYVILPKIDLSALVALIVIISVSELIRVRVFRKVST